MASRVFGASRRCWCDSPIYTTRPIRATSPTTSAMLLDRYVASLDEDKRYLFGTYEYVDLARKVVGVGSVGTRAWVLLFAGRQGQDSLVLQMKEAQASVLEAHLGASEFEHHGERVVRGQRMDQAVTDLFLGWQRSQGLDGQEHDFYIRQLWDWKASMDLSTMRYWGLHAYSRACGWSLARAHARSGDRLRDRRLPRRRAQIRPGDGTLLSRVRRSERTRLPAADRGGGHGRGTCPVRGVGGGARRASGLGYARIRRRRPA